MTSLSLPAALPRQAVQYACGLLGLFVLFSFVGPPLFAQGVTAQVVRLVYAVAVLSCVWRLVGALPVPSGARWAVLGVSAILLKDVLFPYYLRPLNVISFGGGFQSSATLLVAGLGGAIPIILFFGFMFGPGLLEDRRRNAARSTGYNPPIDWVFQGETPESVSYSSGGASTTPAKANRTKLLTGAVLEERAAMPPFTLWYHQGDYTAHPKPDTDRWSFVVDGNHKLASSNGPMPVYLQKHVHAGNGFAGRLRLFQITPEIAQDMTRGPLRKISIHAIRHADGQRVSLTIPAGVAGASVPLPPRVAGGTHGSSGVGDGSIDAEPA